MMRMKMMTMMMGIIRRVTLLLLLRVMAMSVLRRRQRLAIWHGQPLSDTLTHAHRQNGSNLAGPATTWLSDPAQGGRRRSPLQKENISNPLCAKHQSYPSLSLRRHHISGPW
ncbi:hypothetical protein DFJ73DRAFT_842806 [Zopfochytrium polystomum]|nr:hypothetical protein DFJ73DRAFT_842806 [Zopfochytrium polystomum]